MSLSISKASKTTSETTPQPQIRHPLTPSPKLNLPCKPSVTLSPSFLPSSLPPQTPRLPSSMIPKSRHRSHHSYANPTPALETTISADGFMTHSSHPTPTLVVLRFIPIIAGVYLSRVALRKHLAGFEAVLLALYAHETTSRAGQAITVNVPDLSHSSIYHETKAPLKKDNTGQSLAVLSPSLEPHGTVRSSRRARIVGVALELYYSKISQMPVGSKVDFCEFCVVWAGQNGDMYKEGGIQEKGTSGTTESEKEKGVSEGRIPLPWELLQPVLRIVGHCLMGPTKNKGLSEAASAACRSLYARSLHDIDPKAILATESLLRLGKLELESNNDFDPTDIPKSHHITL